MSPAYERAAAEERRAEMLLAIWDRSIARLAGEYVAALDAGDPEASSTLFVLRLRLAEAKPLLASVETKRAAAEALAAEIAERSA